MNTSQLNILVTGGGGFIGKALSIRLIQLGYNVTSLSRNVYPELKAMGISSIEADITNLEAIMEACNKIDVVFHIAAKVGVWGTYKDFYKVNVRGTENIIKACKHHNITKLIFTSSASVIFDGNDIINGDESLLYPKYPQSFYTETKGIAEKMILQANSEILKTISLRPHIVWGPGDTNIIPGIIKRARKKQVKFINNGLAKIDTTYIDNLVDAQILALEKIDHHGISGDVFFITDDDPIEIRMFINSILSKFGFDEVHKSINYNFAMVTASIIEFWYRALRIDSEPRITRFIIQELSKSHWFNISKAKELLGYSPKVTIQEGINRL